MATTVEAADYRIEPATEGDWPWILQGLGEIAWQRLDHEQQIDATRPDIERSVARDAARIRGDADFVTQAFVAKTASGNPVGFVWVAKDHNDTTGQIEASLLNQYVDEAHRGCGLGHRLLETAEEWARQQGLPRIALSVGVRNTLGQRLYESLGYEIETLRMSKSLGPAGEDAVRLTNY